MENIKIEVGCKFPTKEVKQRAFDIMENTKLYKGKQTEIYLDAFLKRLELAGVDHFRGSINKDNYIAYDTEGLKGIYKNILQGINMTSPICDFYADTLFGEGVEITDEAHDEWLQGTEEEEGWLDRVNFNRNLRLGQVGGGYRGDAIIKVWQDEEGLANITVIPSEYWLPYKDKRTYAHKDMLVHEISLNEGQQKYYDDKYSNLDQKKIIRVVTYEVGFNTYQAFLIVGEYVKEQVEWNEENYGELPINAVLQEDGKTFVEETGYSFSMLQRVPCRELDDSLFGKAFITDTFKEQERELCVRATQRARILDKDADPGMTGPSDIIGKDPISGKNIVRSQGKYIPRNKDDAEVKYVTWEGNLLESREAEKKALEYIYQETGTNASVFSSTTEGMNVLSGAALEKIWARSLTVVKSLKMNWTPAIKRILRLAYQIENEGKDELRPDLIFNDGLPESKQDETTNLITQNGKLPVISQKESIRRANPTYSDEQIEEMYQEMLQEQKDREGQLGISEQVVFGEE